MRKYIYGVADGKDKGGNENLLEERRLHRELIETFQYLKGVF